MTPEFIAYLLFLFSGPTSIITFNLLLYDSFDNIPVEQEYLMYIICSSMICFSFIGMAYSIAP